MFIGFEFKRGEGRILHESGYQVPAVRSSEFPIKPYAPSVGNVSPLSSAAMGNPRVIDAGIPPEQCPKGFLAGLAGQSAMDVF